MLHERLQQQLKVSWKVEEKGTCRRRLGGIIFLKTPEKREQWVRNVSKGLEGFQVIEQKTVCTNHFKNGKPTFAPPASTLFLTLGDNSKYSPQKRKLPTRQQILQEVKVSVQSHQDSSVQYCIINPLSAGSMTFAQVTRERDVRFYNRNANYCCLQVAFWTFLRKSKCNALLKRWERGNKICLKTQSLKKIKLKTGALSLEQVFLLCLMTQRQGFLVEDLAFRFKLCDGTVSNSLTGVRQVTVL